MRTGIRLFYDADDTDLVSHGCAKQNGLANDCYGYDKMRLLVMYATWHDMRMVVLVKTC